MKKHLLAALILLPLTLSAAPHPPQAKRQIRHG
jgi:hypothetical protein